MKFYSSEGVELDITQFEPGSLVIARVTKEMTNSEFKEFCKNNSVVNESFQDRDITLLFCPDWVEFTVWS